MATPNATLRVVSNIDGLCALDPYSARKLQASLRSLLVQPTATPRQQFLNLMCRLLIERSLAHRQQGKADYVARETATQVCHLPHSGIPILVWSTSVSVKQERTDGRVWAYLTFRLDNVLFSGRCAVAQTSAAQEHLMSSFAAFMASNNLHVIDVARARVFNITPAFKDAESGWFICEETKSFGCKAALGAIVSMLDVHDLFVYFVQVMKRALGTLAPSSVV